MVQSSETDTPIFPPSDLLSDEPPWETYRHLKQIILLLTSLERLWQYRQDFFAGANLSIYYSNRQRKSEDVRGPDLFVVLEYRTQRAQKLGSLGGRWQVSQLYFRDSFRLHR